MPLDLRPHLVDGEPVAIDDELGAVPPPRGWGLHLLGPRVLRRRPLEALKFLAAHPFEKAFKDQLQPKSPGVDHPRLLEDRQLLGCSLNGRSGRRTGGANHLGQVAGLGGFRLCAGSDSAAL